jgi:tRNA threonylcarbamoyladenosine biosynthesis protein TsaE
VINFPHCKIITESPDETFDAGVAIGCALAKNLSGSVGNLSSLGCLSVAISGTLGAGKTCLVKGIASGAGVTEPVTSPTYTIVNEYEGAVPVFHIDAYRLSGADDFESSGAAEYLQRDGICIVEWCEVVEECLGGDALRIYINILPNNCREISCAGFEGFDIAFPPRKDAAFSPRKNDAGTVNK